MIPTPTPTPVVVPTPTPVPNLNVYPLQMPTNVAPGATVDMGVGPDMLTVQVANNPASGAIDCSMALELDGVVVAGPLDVSSNAGMVGGQIFKVHGPFGPPPHALTFLNGYSTTQGLSGLWMNGASLNFLPFYFNGPSLDSRGSLPAPNSVTVWDNIGAPFTMTSTKVVVVPTPTPVPPVPADSITGATINGVVASTGTLAALVALVPANGTLVLPAGTFHGTTVVPVAMTISGAGAGKTIIDGTGIVPTYKKALFVPNVAGVVISNMTIQNASVSAADGGNAAAVRDSGAGIGFTLNNVEITNCQDGILTFASNIQLQNSNFHGNGASNIGGSSTHEMYINGSPTTVVTLTGTSATSGLLATHAVKSRAGTTNITGGVFVGNSDDGTNGGSVIDIPDGGVATITNAVIKTGMNAGNHGILTHAEESSKNDSN